MRRLSLDRQRALRGEQHLAVHPTVRDAALPYATKIPCTLRVERLGARDCDGELVPSAFRAWSVRVPGTGTTVAVERVPMAMFHAEYERTVIVDVDQGMTLLTPAATVERTLTRLDDRRALLLDADASYTIDLATGAVVKGNIRRKTGAFIGSVDVDESARWRFIPAAERVELDTVFTAACNRPLEC
jgi:hypothetical protein